MKTLILELPGLLDAQHAKDMSHPIEALSLPTLTRMLSKADKLHLKQYTGLMYSRLEQIGALNPLWAVGYLNLKGPDDHYQYWLRADPVELQTDINAVYLKGNRHINLNHDGIELTKQHFQDCFAEYDAKFFMVSSQEGYIGFNTNQQIEFVPLLESLSKNQLMAIPQGKDVAFWNNLLAEIQMSISGNTAPSLYMSKMAPVNSVYFWGDSEASLPEMDIDRLVSNSNLLLGLASEKNIAISKLAETSVDKILECFSVNNTIQIVETELLWLRKQGLVNEWQEKIFHLEQDWLEKIIQALENKQIDEVRIVSSEKNSYRLTASNLKRFWRRIKPVSNFLEHSEKE